MVALGPGDSGQRSRPRRSPLAAALPALLVLCFLFGAATPAGAEAGATPTRAEHIATTVTAARTVSFAEPAEHVAVYWGGNPQARVTLAFSSDGTHFGEPVDAGRDELGQQRDNDTTYGAVQDARGAVAVRVTTDRPLARLTLLGMSDGTAAAQRSSGAPAAAVAVQPLVVSRALAVAAADQPLVVSRVQWGADESLMKWAPQFYQTRKLIVHHTATPNDYADRAAAESQIRSIYYYHAVTQGWGDIGYNFLIDKFGNVYEGRYSRNYDGADPSGDDASGNGVTAAHTSGWNSGTVGVALLGTFTDQDITAAARSSLEALLAWEASRNGIDPQATESFANPVSGATITTPNIAGHLDYFATECPGAAFYATLPTIRSDVAARISDGSTPDTTAPTVIASGAADGAWYHSAKNVTLSATDESGGSGVTSITYALDGVETSVPNSTAMVSVPASPNARHTLTFHATDAAANSCADQMLSFAIDSTGPTTAGKAISGRRGRAVALRYKVADNLSPKTTAIRIVVKNNRNVTVKTIRPTARNTATWYAAKWTPKARGTYRYYVYGRDLAGNAQSKIGSAKVVIR